MRVTNPAGEAISREILGAHKAEGMSALGQNWGHKQLQADGAGEDLLIDEGPKLMGIYGREGVGGGLPDQFVFGEVDQDGRREREKCVLGFPGSCWLASVFSHTKNK